MLVWAIDMQPTSLLNGQSGGSGGVLLFSDGVRGRRCDRRMGGAVTIRERRKNEVKPGSALKRDLNQDQILALSELEKFGWELKFIRRPMFQQPVPIVFDSDRKHFAVLNADGTLDETPGFDIRK